MTSATNPSCLWMSGSLWDMSGRAQIITLIGAGGKTTCLQKITKEIASAGLRLIATTTTKVFPEHSLKVWKDPDYPPPQEQGQSCFWYAEIEEKSGKWIGPSLKTVDEAIDRELCFMENKIDHKRFWVIEGDGARGRKLKCWASHEPQIPRRTVRAVLVLDGGLWGRVLQAEQVHRPENCPGLIGPVWHAEKAWDYFLKSPVFAPQYNQMSWVILLNFNGNNTDNQFSDSFIPRKSLQDLVTKWAEIQGKIIELKSKPKHLRLAAGDAEEGKIEWCDLW